MKSLRFVIFEGLWAMLILLFLTMDSGEIYDLDKMARVFGFLLVIGILLLHYFTDFKKYLANKRKKGNEFANNQLIDHSVIFSWASIPISILIFSIVGIFVFLNDYYQTIVHPVTTPFPCNPDCCEPHCGIDLLFFSSSIGVLLFGTFFGVLGVPLGVITRVIYDRLKTRRAKENLAISFLVIVVILIIVLLLLYVFVQVLYQ